MDLYATPRSAPLPERAHQRSHWPEIAAELNARLGQWAAIGTQDTGRHPLNRPKLTRLGLECTTRANGDGTWTIWMRGIGATPARTAARSTFKWFKGERRTVAAAA